MTVTTSNDGGQPSERETASTARLGPPSLGTATETTLPLTRRMAAPDGSGLPLGLVASIELLRRSLLHDAHGPRYSPVDRLGAGAQGVVWRVSDRDCRRELAFKLLATASASSEEAARFVMEAQITAQLEHPGIPPVHDIGRLNDGTLFYSMKCVEGQHLADHLLPRAGRTEHRFALLQIFLSICQTVAFAHSKGVIHRDLKPKNVMIGRYGEVLIMDWGLAKLIGTDEDSSAVRSDRMPMSDDAYQTMHGIAVGTPAYMSPEQAAGDIAGLDPRCDVYSLGVLLYEMLAGVSPYQRGDVRRVLRQCREGSWTRLDRRAANVPRPLIAITHRALALARDQRYQTAEALADDVRAFLVGDPIAAYPDRITTTLRRYALRHRTALRTAGLAISLAVGIAGSGWLFDRWRTAGTVSTLRSQAEREEAEGQPDQALITIQRLQEIRPGDPWATANQRRLATERQRRTDEQQRLQARMTEAGALVSAAHRAFAWSRQSAEQAEPYRAEAQRLRSDPPIDAATTARLRELEQAATRAEHSAATLDAAGVEALDAALRLVPDHPEACQAMADWCVRALRRAEAHGDVTQVAVLALRARHYDTAGRYAEVLNGLIPPVAPRANSR